jgi:hypothetical protein
MLNQPPLALLAMLSPPPGPVDLPPLPRPAPPPLPLPADPDTITGWLTLPANKLTEVDATQRLRGVVQCYDDLAAKPDAPAIQGLVSECMTADELTCFVTTVGGPGIAPYVVLVHCLSPYTAGFDTTSQFQGKTFGFLGEGVGAQLPPPRQGATQWSRGNREPHQCGHPGPRRGARPLWEPRGEHPNDRPGSPHLEKLFPKLLFMPNRWAPYFMAAQTPYYQAFCMWQTLVATMSVQAGRDDVDIPILNWFGAVCVRAGNGNVQRTRSSLAIEWGSVLPDRSLLRWATKRLASFRLPMPIQPPYSNGLPPLPPGPPAAQAALPERRTFTPQENRIINAASSLQPTDQRLPIYDVMMEEGRTLPRIKAILQEAFVPLPDAESPIHIFVSADLVRDIKDLRFGFNNDLSFEICHHGISPFTVAAMSHEQAKPALASAFTKG